MRVLQENEFERLGGSKVLKTNVRVLAATNRDPDSLRADGKFRDDLFFRLNVFRLNVFPLECPPLRDRKDDIPMLVEHFFEKYNKKIGRSVRKIPSKIIETLQAYHWPGSGENWRTSSNGG
ncbi:MAG: hypothetical protein GY866_33980 [Proteobacteria bacterium]|nr:hypothetical protein [Pseudomonadota bacterium]